MHDRGEGRVYPWGVGLYVFDTPIANGFGQRSM